MAKYTFIYTPTDEEIQYGAAPITLVVEQAVTIDEILTAYKGFMVAGTWPIELLDRRIKVEDDE